MRLGPYQLRNAFALAPMAGIADVPFRSLAWQLGAGYMVSEMVSSKPELWESGKSRLRRIPVPGAQPVAIQIAGTDPSVMAAAAQRHVDDGVQVIDINFGCPAKKVCRKSAGSALLSDLNLIGRIVERVANAVSVPVTVKTRTGLVPGDGVGVQAAVVAAQAGAQLITIHGRSRACKFNGNAHHHAARLIKEQVDVPVFVNGDIQSRQDAEQAIAISGADGVMIGRGAFGQPWLFSELAYGTTLPLEHKWALIVDHVAAMHDFYGELQGLRIARKHVGAYLQRLQIAEKTHIFQKINSAQGQIDWLRIMSEQYSIAA